MRSTLSLLALGSVLLLACGEDAEVAPATLGTTTPSGVVKSVEGAIAPLDGAVEGKGAILLDVVHTDRAVNQKVKVSLKGEGGSAVGEGNQEYALPAGTYSATLRYSEGELSGKHEGTIEGLQSIAGKIVRYQVMLDAPIGLLDLNFSTKETAWNPAADVTGDVTLEVWKSADDPELATPMWSGSAQDNPILPAGTYRARGLYVDSRDRKSEEWFTDLVIESGLNRTERAVEFDLDFTGIRIEAFNYGKPVDDRTTVYFYRQGANMDFAVAVSSGRAGAVTPVDPGVYDLRIVYLPTEKSLDLKGELVLPGLVVPESGGVTQRVDLAYPLSRLLLKVVENGSDISDRAEIRVVREGADAEAAASTLDEVGVGEHYVPVGDYDVYLTVNALEGPPRRATFSSIALENGAVWEQTFDMGEAEWKPAATKTPEVELKPIPWSLPGAVGSAGDDDDSAGDDDDSAAE